jgi:hypothetical protein
MDPHDTTNGQPLTSEELQHLELVAGRFAQAKIPDWPLVVRLLREHRPDPPPVWDLGAEVHPEGWY